MPAIQTKIVDAIVANLRNKRVKAARTLFFHLVKFKNLLTKLIRSDRGLVRSQLVTSSALFVL